MEIDGPPRFPDRNVGLYNVFYARNRLSFIDCSSTSSEMDTLRFAVDDDDDLYSGFDTVHPALDTRHLESDPGFQEAVRTSHGRRPPVGWGLQANIK
ncbi:Intraflagellar transport protein 88 [Portunus trituberculatus]|uniref:Intraflagellar transport protein 88 n=1 Tax=Portunus trituberculatus TaxID=210409 RepID=A0A5B7F9E0_PORTR|nr:Intraflagellar transport protein 88 [Portunus trituberculatus]